MRTILTGRQIICLLFLLLIPGLIHTSAGLDNQRSASLQKLEMVLSDGQKLRYGLYLPGKKAGTEGLPLILALHYGGRVTPFYGYDFMALLVEPAFRRFGALIAAPDCPGSDWSGPEAQAALLELLQHLQDVYRFDSRRLVVCGFSMGGRGTWQLLVNQPELFSAALVLAGSSAGIDLDALPRVPLYIIHGAADEILPLRQVRETYHYLKEKGYPVKLEVLPQVSHYSTAAYVAALTGTQGWLRRVWKNRE